jgi:hypothetical protein
MKITSQAYPSSNCKHRQHHRQHSTGHYSPIPHIPNHTLGLTMLCKALATVSSSSVCGMALRGFQRAKHAAVETNAIGKARRPTLRPLSSELRVFVLVSVFLEVIVDLSQYL